MTTPTDTDKELRAIWTAKGVPVDRQDELIAAIVAKSQIGARLGPFILGETTEHMRKRLLAEGYRVDGKRVIAP